MRDSGWWLTGCFPSGQVLSMFDKAEKEYNDLIKKKKIVEEDKAKVPPSFPPCPCVRCNCCSLPRTDDDMIVAVPD